MIELVSQGVSVKSACQVVGLSRSTFYRQPTDWRARDAAVIAAIQLMLQNSPKAGFWKIVKRLKLKLSLQSQAHLPRLLSSWLEYAAPHQTNAAQAATGAVVG